MKKYLFTVLCLAITLSSGICFTSCSDSDDDGYSFDDPAYLESSAKFNITDTSSGIASIELTESGDYIVTDASYMRYAAKARANEQKHLFKNVVTHNSRAQYGGISYGKYTKDGENTYNLIGYGTITVVKQGESAVSLDIVRDNGTTITASATVSETSTSAMTNKLCRTWNLDKLRMQLSITGLSKFDKTVKVSSAGFDELYRAQVAWLEKNGMNYDDNDFFDEIDDYPVQVIFTRAGTYMVLYNDGSLDVAMWRWYNESKGQIFYAWDDSDWSDWDDADEDNLVEISFSGSNMVIREGWDGDYGYVEDYGNLKVSYYIDYYLSEEK